MEVWKNLIDTDEISITTLLHALNEFMSGGSQKNFGLTSTMKYAGSPKSFSLA